MGNNLYNSEIEEAVIACVLKDGTTFSYLNDICEYTDFYWKPYSWLWQSFLSLVERGQAIDSLTVQDELQRKDWQENFVTATGGLRGSEALNKIKSIEINVENAESYAMQVKDDSGKRQVKEKISRASEQLSSGNTSIEVLTYLENELGRISAFSGAKSNMIAHTDDVLKIAMESTEVASKGNRKYIETGLKDLDHKIGGFFNGQLITVAGRTGEGKSSLLLTLAMNIACENRWKKKVGIFSLEMSNEEYMQRMISYYSGISSLKLKKGEIKEEEYKSYYDAIEQIKKGEIMMDDTPHLPIPLLRTKLRKMKESGVQIIFIDQLDLLDYGSSVDAEYIRVNRLSYKLKKLAREIDLPIVVAQQMSRSIENSARAKDNDPKSSDLSQAGESAPSMIIMIRHKKEQNVIKSSRLYIVKNRDGGTGYIDVKFVGERTKFMDIEPGDAAPIGFGED
jgi:replicative DNA helicase